MKARPTADYPVRVVREANEVLDANASHYEGIYTVVLNHTVHVVFVPDVSAQAPPWDGRQLPADLDLVATTEQARIEMVLSAAYAVTPNARLAGQVDRIPEYPRPVDAGRPPTPAEQRRGWVRYVEPEAFDRYAADLPRLHEVTLSQSSGAIVSGLLEFEVIRFIAGQIAAAAWLHPYDARMLGRAETGESR